MMDFGPWLCLLEVLFLASPPHGFHAQKKTPTASWIAPRNGLKEQTFGYFLSRSDKAGESLCCFVGVIGGTWMCQEVGKGLLSGL